MPSYVMSNIEDPDPDIIVSEQYMPDMITEICTLEEDTVIIIEIILIIIIKERDIKANK